VVKERAAPITATNMIVTGWFHHVGAGVRGVSATPAKTRTEGEAVRLRP
jgi:hypothetical protein